MWLMVFVLAATIGSEASSSTFLQRLVDNGYSKVQTVFVGALPAGWTPPVALPQGLPILGSIKRFDSAEIFYQPPDAAASAAQYSASLKSEGFSPRRSFGASPGFSGSANVAPTVTVFCRDKQSVSVRVVATDDLRINIAEPASLGTCASGPQHAFSSPVPDLVAPPDTSIFLTGGNGGYVGTGPGAGGSLSSSALIDSPMTLPALMSAFTAQMKAAHWKAGAGIAGTSGAVQGFSYDDATTHWRASLAMYPMEKTHSYAARIDATGAPISVAAPHAYVSPVRPNVRLRRSDEPAVLQLAERAASMGGFNAAIYLRRLAPGLDRRIPLPAGTLLGSTLSRNEGFFMGLFGASRAASAMLYYRESAAQYERYLQTLELSGWKPMPLPFQEFRGFVAAMFSGQSTFCKPGLPPLTVRVTPNSNDITLSLTEGVAAHDCSAPLFHGLRGRQAFSPLPPLHAPTGSWMNPEDAGVPGGRNGATIITSKSLPELLQGFAAQMTANDWIPGAALTSQALGTQTFSHRETAPPQDWQAVLTIYRSQNDPKTYYAFIDVTNLRR